MDDAALVRMQALAARTHPQHSGHHPGGLAWSVRSVQGQAAASMRFWREDGVDAGWAWADGPASVELCIDIGHPHATDVAREAVAWFTTRAPDDEPSRTTVRADEHLLLEVLHEAGFLPEDGPFFVDHHLDLARLGSLPPASPAPGYRLKAVRDGEAAPRAACHRAAWGSPEQPSRVTTTSYAAVMASPTYRTDLDWVAVAGDGSWVASCLVWLDPASGVALVEPVGCAPDHRRRGLASAVSLAALHAARDAGASSALVCPRGDRAYPAPLDLYQKLGFEPGERTVTLVREPD